MRSLRNLSVLLGFTFIVLADLTPIRPTHYVVITLLLVNASTVLLLLGIIVREVWLIVQGLTGPLAMDAMFGFWFSASTFCACRC